MTEQQIERLEQRRRWLTERIAAKQKIGWDVEYDVSERDALEAAIPILQWAHWRGVAWQGREWAKKAGVSDSKGEER